MELKDGLITKLEPDEIDALRMMVKMTAQTCLGVPYKFGAKPLALTGKPSFLDCSGLTFYAYMANRLYLPHGSQCQYNYLTPIKTPEKGDLAFMGHERSDHRVYHVGVYVGDGMICEARDYDGNASFETGKVILRPAEKWEGYKNFLGYRRHTLL